MFTNGLTLCACALQQRHPLKALSIRMWCFFYLLIFYCFHRYPRPLQTLWTTAPNTPEMTLSLRASLLQTTPSRKKNPALYCSGCHLAFICFFFFFFCVFVCLFWLINVPVFLCVGRNWRSGLGSNHYHVFRNHVLCACSSSPVLFTENIDPFFSLSSNH